MMDDDEGTRVCDIILTARGIIIIIIIINIFIFIILHKLFFMCIIESIGSIYSYYKNVENY